MMLSQKLQFALLSALYAFTALPAQAATNLLANGSFETPGNAGADVVYYSAGSTGITGWTVVGGPIHNTLASYLPASDGSQWVDLTGNFGYDKGLRSDAVNTNLGTSYELSFDLGDYELYGSASVSVSINGGAPLLFSNVYQSGKMDWERKTLTWVADATTAQITFLGVANGNLSNDGVIGLDNVVLSAVPEPGTWGMLLAGLGLVGVAARRRGFASRG